MNILASKKYVFMGLLTTFALAGCQLSEQLEDVSNQKKYELVIGKEYVLEQDLLTYEIRDNRGNFSEASYRMASTYPGISGPEVKKIGVLQAGELVKVTKVIRCENCAPNFDYFVIAASGNPALDFRVRSVGNQEISDIGEDGFVRLNPDIFASR